MEVSNDLLGYKDLKIVQNTDWFSFSLDSVLLANFIKIKKSDKLIMDLGTGNAPIPLILSTRTKAKIHGLEIQKEVFELAQKSISINKLCDQIDIINIDANDVSSLYETDSFDIITSNPPYFKINNNSLRNSNDQKSIARHEVKINIDDILRIAKKMLKNNGILGIVHRPERLIEILIKMKSYNIEPKRIQFIYPKKSGEANIMLIEGSKNGNEGLKIMPPLYVYDSEGNYTDDVKSMFGE